jgi:hypothetical protein
VVTQQTQPRRARAHAEAAARWLSGRARAGGRWLGTRFDRWDGICTLGLVLFAVGLTLWFHLGVSLTVVGALVIGLGVSGARQDAAAEPDPRQRGG